MSFELGNDNWKKRTKSGANLKYSALEVETLWNDFLKWIETQTYYRSELIKSGEKAGTVIEVPMRKPITLKSFCIYSGIDDETLKSYASKENEKTDTDLFAISLHVIESCNDYIDGGCLSGALVAAYGAKLRGLSDTIRVDQESKTETVLISFGKKKIDLSK
jgi:hypothetical protein